MEKYTDTLIKISSQLSSSIKLWEQIVVIWVYLMNHHNLAKLFMKEWHMVFCLTKL